MFLKESIDSSVILVVGFRGRKYEKEQTKLTFGRLWEIHNPFIPFHHVQQWANAPGCTKGLSPPNHPPRCDRKTSLCLVAPKRIQILNKDGDLTKKHECLNSIYATIHNCYKKLGCQTYRVDYHSPY